MIDNEIVNSLSTSLCASAYKSRHSFERPIICLRCSSLRQHGSTSLMSWVGPVGLSDRDVCYLKLYRLLNMELYGFVADNMQWYEGEKLARKSSRVGVSEEVIMPRAAGRRDGGASRNVMCVLFPLTAVFLFLSVGVTAIQEEQKAVPEQPPQEVKGFVLSSCIGSGLWRASSSSPGLAELVLTDTSRRVPGVTLAEVDKVTLEFFNREEIALKLRWQSFGCHDEKVVMSPPVLFTYLNIVAEVLQPTRANLNTSYWFLLQTVCNSADSHCVHFLCRKSPVPSHRAQWFLKMSPPKGTWASFMPLLPLYLSSLSLSWETRPFSSLLSWPCATTASPCWPGLCWP